MKSSITYRFFALLLGLFINNSTLSAQPFSPSVKQFISIDADTTALIHCTIIDGTGAPAKADQTIIIIHGRITAIDNAGNSIVPLSAKSINCTGKTVIPGMIMMHEHLFYGESAPPLYLAQAMPVSFPKLYLAGGVTTMRTAGSVEPQTDLNIKRWINEGKIIGPNIDVTGPYIEGEGFPIPEFSFIKTPVEAADLVNYWANKGCTSFKLYENVTRAEAKAAIDAAHKHGAKVTAHLSSVTYREAADMGIDNLEHGFWVCSDFDSHKKEDTADDKGRDAALQNLPENSEAMKSLMAYLIKKNVAVTSTLPVFEPCAQREAFPGNGGDAVDAQIKTNVERMYQVLTQTPAGRHYDSLQAIRFKKEMDWEKQFVQMGGKLMAGVDPTGNGDVVPGYADRYSLELLTRAGFTLPQAVQICSLNAAEYLGIDKVTGSIAVGKNADLVLINGNIEKNIRNVENTEIVFKKGIGFNSRKLFESVKGMVGIH